jgi:hypothetical protein
MDSPIFSFTFITPQELENRRNRRKASAVTLTTAALPGKPPHKFSAPVGVVSKLKKKKCLGVRVYGKPPQKFSAPVGVVSRLKKKSV